MGMNPHPHSPVLRAVIIDDITEDDALALFEAGYESWTDPATGVIAIWKIGEDSRPEWFALPEQDDVRPTRSVQDMSVPNSEVPQPGEASR